MIYTVQIRFNGRLSGSKQVWNGEVEADSVIDAIDTASAAAVREPRHGHSIFVTGVTVEATRESAQ